ncbi:zinc finger ccch domain-containing protein [Anaeramoeba flamelloides]|uniref:Zinc finger ccch domain-containing protein n=1 Tax=Anaeramoeba flamelloides TaxID=1746091 RepID=A0ABQ8Y2C9_9EUKA|nr:zinc finger ccch domain-containing protein [Anaeramoeba flamelloides]
MNQLPLSTLELANEINKSNQITKVFFEDQTFQGFLLSHKVQTKFIVNKVINKFKNNNPYINQCCLYIRSSDFFFPLKNDDTPIVWMTNEGSLSSQLYLFFGKQTIKLQMISINIHFESATGKKSRFLFELKKKCKVKTILQKASYRIQKEQKNLTLFTQFKRLGQLKQKKVEKDERLIKILKESMSNTGFVLLIKEHDPELEAKKTKQNFRKFKIDRRVKFDFDKLTKNIEKNSKKIDQIGVDQQPNSSKLINLCGSGSENENENEDNETSISEIPSSDLENFFENEELNDPIPENESSSKVISEQKTLPIKKEIIFEIPSDRFLNPKLQKTENNFKNENKNESVSASRSKDEGENKNDNENKNKNWNWNRNRNRNWNWNVNKERNENVNVNVNVKENENEDKNTKENKNWNRNRNKNWNVNKERNENLNENVNVDLNENKNENKNKTKNWNTNWNDNGNENKNEKNEKKNIDHSNNYNDNRDLAFNEKINEPKPKKKMSYLEKFSKKKYIPQNTSNYKN